MEGGVSDVRVCHPKCGEATFVVTMVGRAESDRSAARLHKTSASCDGAPSDRAAFHDASGGNDHDDHDSDRSGSSKSDDDGHQA
eukprot:2457840-Pleurochrysis_carterae.AAC.11